MFLELGQDTPNVKRASALRLVPKGEREAKGPHTEQCQRGTSPPGSLMNLNKKKGAAFTPFEAVCSSRWGITP